MKDKRKEVHFLLLASATSLWESILSVSKKGCKPFLKHCPSELSSPSCYGFSSVSAVLSNNRVIFLTYNYVPFISSLPYPSLQILTLICSLSLGNVSFYISSAFPSPFPFLNCSSSGPNCFSTCLNIGLFFNFILFTV